MIMFTGSIEHEKAVRRLALRLTICQHEHEFENQLKQIDKRAARLNRMYSSPMEDIINLLNDYYFKPKQ